MLALVDRTRTTPALIDDATGNVWTHDGLHGSANELADQLLSDRKELVLVRAASHPSTVIASLGALAAGHAVLLVDTDSTQIEQVYAPRFVIDSSVITD